MVSFLLTGDAGVREGSACELAPLERFPRASPGLFCGGLLLKSPHRDPSCPLIPPAAHPIWSVVTETSDMDVLVPIVRSRLDLSSPRWGPSGRACSSSWLPHRLVPPRGPQEGG